MEPIEFKDSRRLDLPPDALSLLSNGSFCAEYPLCVSFCLPSARLQTLEEWCIENQLLAKENVWGHYYRIGDDGGGQLCLESGTGRLVSIDPLGRYCFRFVNSSLGLFLEFLRMFDAYTSGVCAMTDNVILERARDMVRHMMDADAMAITTKGSWWGSVIEQIEEELS